ncbi:MAG: alcohol dehydrogenase catalytic domain-containing protein [Firmicutes bacterium]|nr:alcohol dehydrogenase catalytic domain-containing protein [Bacillota bacterium]
MVITKAMVLREFNQPLLLEEVDQPGFGSEEVLLKVKAVGVCGTDLKIQRGEAPTKELPLIPGHEVAGVVAATGEKVRHFRVGDEVLVSFYIPCNRCRACLNGRQTICENLKGRIGFELDGGFAEYVAVPETCLLPKPPTLTFREAAVIPDAIATCYHALAKRAKVKAGDYLLMLGAGGGLGLHALQLARWLGARTIGVDVSTEKLRLMQEYGAEVVIDGRDPAWSSSVLDYTGGHGADHVVNFVYHEQSIGEALKALGKGGQLVMIAYAEEFKFDALRTHLFEIDLLGTRAATKVDIEECIKLVVEQKVKPVIGEVLKLEELNAGLQLIQNGNLKGRLVLDIE